MFPSSEDDKRQILHASVFDAECKDSPYFEEALLEVTKEYIKYNLTFSLREVYSFCIKNFPLLPKGELISVCLIIISSWEIVDSIDDPRHDIRLRIHQLESARSAVTSGKIEPYMNTSHCLLHHINKIKCGYLQERLKHEYLSYIDIVQKKIYTENRTMSIEEYMKYRRIDALCDYVFMLMFLDFDDFRPYYNYFLSEEGKKMRYLTSEIDIIHNDLASLIKDKEEGKTSNYVLIWMQSFDVTQDEAIDALALKAKELFQELLLLRDTVVDSIGKDVLQKLILKTSGHLTWCTQSGRYF